MLDTEKVKHASYLLRDDVTVWWKMTIKTHKVAKMTWTKFRRLFDKEYKITNMTYLRAYKFTNLQQGSNPVKEYAIRFNALTRYALGMTSTTQ